MEKAIHTLLRSHGLKATRQRSALLSQLRAAGEPMATEDLRKRLEERMNIATLYRALSDLVRAGLIYQTDFRAGRAYYEFQAHHHHHIICTACGKKERVEICDSQWMDAVEQNAKHFSSISSHMLEFFGVCRECQGQ